MTNTTSIFFSPVVPAITIPSVSFERVFATIGVLFNNIYSPVSNGFSSVSDNSSPRARRAKFGGMGNMKFNVKKKYFKIILPIVLLVIVVVGVGNIVRTLPDAQSRPITTTKPVVTQDTLATMELNRKFVFPLKDAKQKTVGNFDYVVQSASLQKQIIVKGQRATAVEGRIFLILNMKITNNLKQTIQLNTRDYLRLVTASNSVEQLAPDIHNDPVEVQAISTKYTRVGMAINEADAKKIIKLKVGEIEGTKQNIDLNFKY